MGLTFTGIFVYSDLAVTHNILEFKSFSPGWQTCITDLNAISTELITLIRNFSKQINDPVLLFHIEDSDEIVFAFYKEGKRIAHTFTEYERNIYKIPELVGYKEGCKKRIADIIACANTNRKLVMLEEFFGVCLTPVCDIIKNDPTVLTKTKGDSEYRKYLEEEKLLRGKKAPIKLELVNKYHGKLFNHLPGSLNFDIPNGYYLYGYYSESTCTKPEFKLVKFMGTDLKEVSPEDAKADCCLTPCFQTCYTVGNDNKIIFNDNAPLPYKNEIIETSSYYFPIGIDSKKRLYIGGECGRLAVFDESSKMIAKLTTKGEAEIIVDDYILCIGDRSLYAYEYDSSEYIYIYKIIG